MCYHKNSFWGIIVALLLVTVMGSGTFAGNDSIENSSMLITKGAPSNTVRNVRNVISNDISDMIRNAIGNVNSRTMRNTIINHISSIARHILINPVRSTSVMLSVKPFVLPLVMPLTTPSLTLSVIRS